ncbi:thioredoxin family protein [Sporosarcina aquimarina]|uniref:monothiol bacilliredoxin BrxC family protein n=1 Tax=Sporosarcina aquimarina TaxID=114975 RepID=UPI00203AC715|nr:monothiol bacilliredoxin BrxC family protein [Sporosarcina aquimarina]MCM3758552.1 thioredoxin family protein [Sporosarcina aquimarina]
MKRLKTIEEWRMLLEKSDEQPFLLFKLSMTSLSSVTAKKEMESLVTDIPRYVVISQLDKKVSNAVELDTSVKHETPQLLIIKGKKAIWQATRYQINQSVVLDAIATYV